MAYLQEPFAGHQGERRLDARAGCRAGSRTLFFRQSTTTERQ